jgi:hypothetical protein
MKRKIYILLGSHVVILFYTKITLRKIAHYSKFYTTYEPRIAGQFLITFTPSSMKKSRDWPKNFRN